MRRGKRVAKYSGLVDYLLTHTIAEAADEYGVSPKTMQSYVWRNQLQSFKRRSVWSDPRVLSMLRSTDYTAEEISYGIWEWFGVEITTKAVYNRRVLLRRGVRSTEYYKK